MTDEEERRAITAAMQRLFAGTPLRSSGKLDVLALAQEAGLKRNKLTHKHTDLKELFYAQRKARDGVPDNEVKLRGQIATLQKTNQTLRDERDRYRLTSETFARALHVLTIENDNYRCEFAKLNATAIKPLHAPPHGRLPAAGTSTTESLTIRWRRSAAAVRVEDGT